MYKKVDTHGYEMKNLRSQCGKTRHADYMRPGFGWDIIYNVCSGEVILSLFTHENAAERSAQFWRAHENVQAFYIYAGFTSRPVTQQYVADLIADMLDDIEKKSGLSALEYCRSRLGKHAKLVEAAQASI